MAEPSRAYPLADPQPTGTLYSPADAAGVTPAVRIAHTPAGRILSAAADAKAQRAALGFSDDYGRSPLGASKTTFGWPVKAPENFTLGSTVTLTTTRELFVFASSDPQEPPPNRIGVRVATPSTDATLIVRIFAGLLSGGPGPADALVAQMAVNVTQQGPVGLTPAALSGKTWDARLGLWYGFFCVAGASGVMPALTRVDVLTIPPPIMSDSMISGRHLFRTVSPTLANALGATAPAFADLSVDTAVANTPGFCFGWAP